MRDTIKNLIDDLAVEPLKVRVSIFHFVKNGDATIYDVSER
ncbi:MAG: hypothetical protein P4L44_08350 [Oryzomonas sp.]|nr:hypothetical protein [Oryzomonas sp.]MDR3579956.1 hypothetical protein [Oryzomonas sp.]